MKRNHKHLIAAGLAIALAGLVGPVLAADNCTLNIDSTDAMKFDLKEATVAASCATITINLTHSGKLPAAAMGHNVVIAKTEDVAGIAKDGIKAGAANSYVPSDDARVVGHTAIIGGGERTTAKFSGKSLVAGGDYSFFCSFPGHSALMKGKLIVK